MAEGMGFDPLSNGTTGGVAGSFGGRYLSSQLVVPSVLGSRVDLCIVSSSLLTVKLEGRETRPVIHI